MRRLIAVLLAALSGAALAHALLPPLDEDLALIAGIALAMTLLLARRRRQKPRPEPRRERKTIILDGSNVMYWDNETPSLAPVMKVLAQVRSEGYTPGVMFDANAGYLLFGEFRGARFLARQLDLYEDNVLVAPKGTPADPLILQAATDMNARVITNDRFRDWAQEFPAVTQPGFLVPGGMKNGEVYLRLNTHEARMTG